MPVKAGVNPYGAYVSSPLLKGAAATFGPVSVVPVDATDEELAHEARHREQFWVPGWSLLKMVDALYRAVGRPEGEVPLERDAYRHVQPTHEMIRGKAPVSDKIGGYLRGLLGE